MLRLPALCTRITANLLIIIVMSVGIMLPASQAVLPKQAEAGNIVYDPTNWIQNNITALSSMSLAQKDLIWDGVFNALAKAFLRQMVDSIVRWINSGFQGSPMFVTDLDGFLRNVADQAVGQLIYDSPTFNYLCSPFQLDVKIALAVQYNEIRGGNYQPQCTLSGVVNNVEGFLAGDFSQGGWGGMIELVQTPSNNPVGAHLDAQAQAYVRIIDNQGQEIATLGYGNGFFSMEICDIADFNAGTRPNCVIGTPGSVIADTINDALGRGGEVLIEADEVNEIFNALFAQLAQKAISGVFGLLGLGGNTAYADSSYGFGDDTSFLDAIQQLDTTQVLDTNNVGNILPMNQSLTHEQEYQAYLNEIITRITTVQNRYNQVEANLQSRNCTLGFPFPTTLSTALTQARTDLANSLNRTNTLQDLITRFDNSTNINEQTAILNEYKQLENQGIFRTSAQNLQTQVYLQQSIIPDITQLDNNITTAEAACSN